MSKEQYYVYSRVEPIIANNNKEFLHLDDVAKRLNDYVKQLAKKDKKLEDLKAQLKASEICLDIVNSPTTQEMAKRIAYQFCNKIGEDLSKLIVRTEDKTHVFSQETIYLQDVVAVLDKLEKQFDNNK